jgi:hypothetical protein
MRRTHQDIVFAVRHGRLVRHVRLRDGRGYTQQCTPEVLEQVAWLVKVCGEVGVTTPDSWTVLPELPCTQISIALAFLKDRGCVETSGRRSYAASVTVYEDALTEFHHLAYVACEGC